MSGSDNAITHKHGHRHMIDHPHALNYRVMSEPHEHSHDHSSARESWNIERDPTHRNHFHTPDQEPRYTR